MSEAMPVERVRRATATLSPTAQWSLFQAALVLNDILLVGLSFLIAYVVRFNLSIEVFQLDVEPSRAFYQSTSLILILVWLLILRANGLYNRQHLLGGIDEYARVFRAASVGMLLVMIVGFLNTELYLARGWLLVAWVGSFLFVNIGRFTLRRLVYFLRSYGFFLSPALIVGANEEGQSLAQQLLEWKTSGLYLVGFVDQVREGTRTTGNLPVLGRLGNLQELVDAHAVEEIIIATSGISRDDMLTIFRHFGMRPGINLRMSSGVFEIITTGLDVNELAYVPLVKVRKVRLTGFDRFLKLLLDYSLTLPGLIALLPAMGILSLLIRLDSPGPAIYRRRVIGLNGQEFDAFKFRTMYVDGDEILARHPALQTQLAADHKLKEDPRVTRVGSFIRKYSLDELPQLLNVLRRDMSLVGPRMISPPEMEKYAQHGMNLLTVKPGITGLWQVSGRSDVSYEERVRLDMHYIRNWTIWLDLQLLFQTIPAVLFKRGAY